MISNNKAGGLLDSGFDLAVILKGSVFLIGSILVIIAAFGIAKRTAKTKKRTAMLAFILAVC